MANGNFKRNLLIGFGASLLILIISSAASFISITNLLNSAALVNQTHTVILRMDEITAAMVDAETGQRGYLLTADESFLKPYLDSRGRALDAYGAVFALTKEDPEQQKMLEQLGKLIDTRFSMLEVSINAVRNGQPIVPENLRKGKSIMEDVRAMIQRMEDREKNFLLERTETMNMFSSFTPPLIIAAALIALLITVLFYAKVRSDFEERVKLQLQLQEKDAEITHRIKIIQDIADKISQGSYEVRINDQQSDSLGSVAVALNRMAGSLEYSFGLLSEKEWQQTGLNQLNDIMIGEKDVDVLCRQILEFLATYTNCQVGALYLLQGDKLFAIAGYASDPMKTRPVIGLNEGLVGQAVASKVSMELKDIPIDNISISYASGEIRPKHLIAVPVLDGYNLKAAFELGSLSEFSTREIEFLKASAPNIGIAIATAQNRTRLQELLGETQSQAEELKSQQSELENINSELEVQAEKLQASEEELKVQQEELRQANQELEERSRLLEERNQLISERNIEIQNKAEQLAQSTRYKSEFLANMSHELRTPLNSILLLSRLMSENQERNLTHDQIEYARVIQNSGQGLLSLIDEILDLSKIEAGKMQLDYQQASVKSIVENMEALFVPMAREKNIDFEVYVDQDVPAHLETDKQRVEQILKNLLSNAIKFTSKGHVKLFVDAEDGHFIRFNVEDTGIGIAHEKHKLVFDAFQQADGSTRRKYGGTGLGLSISRELARLLGGEIFLKSVPGQGSEFSVRIPLSREIKDKRQEKAVRNIIDEKSLEIESVPVLKQTSQYISTEIPADIPDDRARIKENDKIILIIEDDTNFAKALLDYTRKKKYKGIVSVRGDEGLELARKFKPLGILLDIQLPVKSGWEVMEELKSDPSTRHIPVHIMSSHHVKSESLLKGAVDFINKPVAFEQMQDVFKKIEYVLTHQPKKVLIVEENPKHAKALAYFLETFDVNLDIATEVDSAIHSLKNQQVDCVILDMGVPDQRSYDTLDEVKKTPGLENLPIIIFTGKSLSQKEEMKIRQYADSIVVKTAHSYKRILDEVSLFLHLMEKNDKENGKSSGFRKLGALEEVLKNKTVLVADDDMRNIYSLTKALERYQMNVIPAVDGKDALQKLRENPKVDIVLMDMMMPELDGYETTAAIRKIPHWKNLPVIAVTAKAMMGDRAKCIEAGASDYITKPVDIDQLFSLLRVWLYEKG